MGRNEGWCWYWKTDKNIYKSGRFEVHYFLELPRSEAILVSWGTNVQNKG